MESVRPPSGFSAEIKNVLRYSARPILDGIETEDILVFFITGNPGLISYYEPFLATLKSLLSTSFSSSSTRFHICGFSLAGFDTLKTQDEMICTLPAGLQDQILRIEILLHKEVRLIRPPLPSNRSEMAPKVILIGHSVGSFILLEIISRHLMNVKSGREDFQIVGGILLFPTITHLSKSSSGLVFSVSPPLMHFWHTPTVPGDILRPPRNYVEYPIWPLLLAY